MLDLALRDASHGQASLRELLQWMNANYAKKGRFFDDSAGVRQAAEAVSHADLGWFFTNYVAGTDEIPWNDFLRSVGLRVETQTSPCPTQVSSRPAILTVPCPSSRLRLAATLNAPARESVIRSSNCKANPSARNRARTSSRCNLATRSRSRVRSRGRERELKWKIGSRQEARTK